MTEALELSTPMLISGVIMAFTFIGIFTENLHGFERAKVALVGAGLMLGVGNFMGFYHSDQAFEAIDWNVIFLLGCMMAIVSIMIPTGGFERMAAWCAQKAKGRQFLLMALLGTAVTVLSLLLDNVTTVVIFGPLIILITQAMKVSPVPYLLAAALLSDTGGVATLVGDPPNLMIGSAADIDFNTFFKHMGGIVFVAWIGTLLAMRFLTRKDLAIEPTGTFEEEIPYHNKPLWIKSVWVLVGMTVLFVLHGLIGWEPWMVAATGLVVLLVMTRHLEVDNVMEQVEIQLLIFFMSLFVLIGGVEHTGFLQWVGGFIIPFVQSDLMVATLVLMWIGAFLSAAIDNIPFTAAMIPIILGLEAQGVNVAPLWWGLALGVGMGGNGTHIGSTANVYIVTISERLAKQQGDRSLAITPLQWFKIGTPVMLLTLVICTVIMYSFWDFFATPLP